MKVLVLTTLFPNRVRPNHAVFVKERMAAFARDTGSEIRVVAPVPFFPRWKSFGRWSEYSDVPDFETVDGLSVCHPRYVVTPKFGMTFYGIAYFLGVRNRVLRLRREYDFDLIDAHYLYPDGLAAVWLGKILGVPVVVSARGTDVNLYSTFPLIRKWLRYILARADAVIAVSNALGEKIRVLGIEDRKLFVVPNGVDPGKFYPEPRDAARARTGLPTGRQVLLSAGNLVPAKGFLRLLRAFRMVTENRPGETPLLAIVGEGPEKGALERFCADQGLESRVLFVGSVPHGEMVHWYGAADLFCLASDREGWPNVVQESLACGTPVVATPVGGIAEILTSAESGIICNGMGDEELARCIGEALDRSWNRSTVAAIGTRRTWANVSLDLSKIFTAVTGGKSS